jgi:hypothetical protein
MIVQKEIDEQEVTDIVNAAIAQITTDLQDI